MFINFYVMQSEKLFEGYKTAFNKISMKDVLVNCAYKR